MIELVEANWLLFVIALIIGIAVAWYVFAATRRTRVETDKRDVLDDNAAPAARNQALLDAAPAAGPATVVPAANPGITAAAGSAVAAVVQEQTAKADSAPPASAQDDDLARIKGVGPKLRMLLAELGVTSVSQVAAWTQDDIDRIDPLLGKFAGRIRRDQWTEQARLLEGGDRAAYEAKFGKG